MGFDWHGGGDKAFDTGRCRLQKHTKRAPIPFSRVRTSLQIWPRLHGLDSQQRAEEHGRCGGRMANATFESTQVI